eukprot:TRINITY_DN9750_c0_g1_i1.p1 TRINITY_DN9750_c0_g1~~TRINITY_DN9750_c0_g1_i1.p1  ORF type:complete len:453 (-),score=38.52 TRINITY_DN9750_c0_g1_i1:21-1379(-)
MLALCDFTSQATRALMRYYHARDLKNHVEQGDIDALDLYFTQELAEQKVPLISEPILVHTDTLSTRSAERDNWSLLHYTIRHGQLSVLNYFEHVVRRSGADWGKIATSKTPRGNTLLHVAVQFNRYDLAQHLVTSFPALLCQPNEWQLTPLHYCTHPKNIKHLLSFRFPTFVLQRLAESDILHYSCRNMCLATADVLVAAGMPIVRGPVVGSGAAEAAFARGARLVEHRVRRDCASLQRLLTTASLAFAALHDFWRSCNQNGPWVVATCGVRGNVVRANCRPETVVLLKLLLKIACKLLDISLITGNKVWESIAKPNPDLVAPLLPLDREAFVPTSHAILWPGDWPSLRVAQLLDQIIGVVTEELAIQVPRLYPETILEDVMQTPAKGHLLPELCPQIEEADSLPLVSDIMDSQQEQVDGALVRRPRRVPFRPLQVAQLLYVLYQWTCKPMK